ncbi:MAG TPA: TetR/AcrR family transcriptional regulator [Gemmatimonadaceae bacterium]|nr:TetR/AcrR family transcriptional regulator [Gemmatimonadaceae bacterium]
MPRRTSAKPPKRKRPNSYHHGDLKAALVACATDILRKAGPSALTLRAVARAAGVSEAAPYRHFADRRELVAAVAEAGFERLGQAMGAAMQQGSRGGLRAVAEAYVRFAHENEAEYRVMFGPEVANTAHLPALRETARSVLAFVAQGIGKLQQAGLVGPGDPGLMAVVTWAQLHGLVMLSLDGQSTKVAPSIEAQVQEATRIMMFGMAAR